MRARIKFAKYDTMRFIGHLDVMRYFQKLFNRANLPIKYTEGFHPHQILSFAQPLGLGITSDGEYLDIELTTEMECGEIVSLLNRFTTRGIEILDAVRLEDRETNRKLQTAMSLISRSVYLILLKDGFEVCRNVIPALNAFMSQKEIKALKKTKKGEKEICLSDYIYEVWDYSHGGFKPIYRNPSAVSVVTKGLADSSSLHAPDFENGIKFIVSLSAGSETNISPELFLETFLNASSLSLNASDFRIHRMELYGGEPDRSVSLCQIL